MRAGRAAATTRGREALAGSTGPDLRLLPPAGAAWGAAWWATGTGSATTAWVVAASLVLPAVVVLAGAPSRPGLHRWRGSAALTAAAAAAVLVSTGANLAARAQGPWPGWVAARAVATIEGVVVTDAARVVEPPSGAGSGGPPPPARGEPRWVLRLDAETATARGATQRLDLPVLVVAPAGWRGVTAGQHVRLTGRLAPPRAGDEMAAVVAVHGPPLRVEEGSWPWRVADVVRASLRRACLGLPERAGGLLPALVVGDTSGLPDELRAELTAAGLSHLTAVSGANLAIMAQSALWVASALRWPRAVRVPLLVGTLLGFVVLARPSPSVLRAAGMGAVAVAAAGMSRRPRAAPALSAAVVVLLVAHPWLARSAGFVLSVVATGALLLLAPRWADGLSRHLPRPLALALAAPAAAQVACAPVVVLLHPAVSVVAVPANLVADPAVAPATVAGVLAALAGTVSPPLASAVAWAGALGTGWIALVAGTASRLPLASVPWPGGVGGALLLAGLEAVAVALTLPAPRHVLLAGVRRQVRPLALVGAVGGLLAVAWSSGLRPPLLVPGGAPADWAVAMCDVGQGDATALRSGPDRAVLVDAGPDPAAVDGCLRRLGVRHLDLVVLTHFHADHVAGLAGALDGRDVGAVLVSPLGRPAGNAAGVLRLTAGRRAPVAVAALGARASTGTAGWVLQWRVVAAEGTAAGPGEDDGTVVNESSVALDVVVRGPAGAVRAVLLGDLEALGQQRLATRLSGAERLDGPVDVVKVAHHGSATQSEELYRRLAARVGLVGVGSGNDYGHPAPSALALLRRAGTQVLRTDLSGDVTVAAGPDGRLTVTTGR